MTTLRLNILHEHALEIIRGLEKLGAISVQEEISTSTPTKAAPRKWGGMIKEPSQGLLTYADKVRGEWEDRI